MAATTMLAAVDGGVARGITGTGTVYAVAATSHDLHEQLRRDRIEDGDFDVIPCTPAAAAYIEEHGGAPSRRLSVTRHGVEIVEAD